MNAERLAEIKRDLEHGGDAAQWPTAAILELVAEVELLRHLHGLDHSLADQWQADNERLRALLARLEWEGGASYAPGLCCPDCEAPQRDGHDLRCELARELLAKTREQS